MKCPKCGSNFEGNYCIRCGYNSEVRNIDNNYPINQNINSRQSTIQTKDIVFLVLSIINVTTVVPFVAQFGIIWMLFGALGDSKITYYGLLLSCIGYVFASIVGVIMFIINICLKGRIFKACIITIFISFIVGFIFPIMLEKSNFSISKSNMKKNIIEVNKVIYDNDNLFIQQKEIKYNKSSVDVILSIEPRSDQVIIPNYFSARVNRCIVSARLIKNDESNLYTLSINYNDLKEYNINDIFLIDMFIRNDNENVLISIKTNSKKTNDKDFLNLSEDRVLYKNEYFKLLYDPNYKYSDFYIYIESLISDNYTLYISEVDADTPGYASHDSFDTKLFDYSILRMSFPTHSCNDNLSYFRAKYKIVDENYKTIKEDTIDINFSNSLVKGKNCNKS